MRTVRRHGRDPPQLLDRGATVTLRSWRATLGCLGIGKNRWGAGVKEKGPKLGTRGLHSEGGGGRGLTAWDAVC